MLVLNLLRAVAWLIVLLLTTLSVFLTGIPVIGIAGFIIAYALVMTLTDVAEQKLIEKFSET